MKPMPKWKYGQPLPDTKDAASDGRLVSKILKTMTKVFKNPDKYDNENTRYKDVRPTAMRLSRYRKD